MGEGYSFTSPWELRCDVCGKYVDTDGDAPAEYGGLARVVPLEGVSARCTSCELIAHLECMADQDECKACREFVR